VSAANADSAAARESTATKIVSLSPRSRARWLIPLAILFAALFHRYENLADYPPRHATDDEFHFIWAGLSLLHTGTPTAWTQLGGYMYTDSTIGSGNFDGVGYTFASPALDHPPLFSVVAGSFAALCGAKPVNVSLSGSLKPNATVTVWDVSFAKVRLLSLILFVATFALLWRIAWLSFGEAVANIALLLYAFDAHVVVHNRLLVSENFTTPLFLLHVWLTLEYLRGRISRHLFAGATLLLIPAALLSKLIAVSQAAAVALMLCLSRRFRDCWSVVAGAALGIAIYLYYGAMQDWNTFREVLQWQSSRFRGFNLLQVLIANQRLVGDLNYNHLLVVGWICLFVQGLRRQARLAAVAPFGYLLLFAYFESTQGVYGWHALPFYPFLCMALGATIVQVWQTPRSIPMIALLTLLLPHAFHTLWIDRMEWESDLRTWYLAIVGITILACALTLKFRQPIMRILLIVTVFLCLEREYWEVFIQGSDR
jgi:hypothetical protein